MSERAAAGETIDVVEIEAGGAMRRASFFYSTPLLGDLAPYGYLFADHAFRSYECGPFTACLFDELTVIGSDGIVLRAGVVVADTLMHIMHWAPGSSTEDFRNQSFVRLRAEMPVSTATDTNVYIGFSAGWRNYAHWMQESLPKLFGFLHLRERRPNLKLVLPRFEPGSFHEQTLRLLAIDPAAIVRIEHDRAVTFQEAWMTTPSDIWSVPPLVPVAAARLVAAVAAREPATGGERIYIHRSGQTRAVANFAAVATMLDAYGFRIVSFETMTVVSQIAIMQSARYVIGEHGAGLANVMFCRAGTMVLELFNPVSPQPGYWSVASAAKLGFGFVVGTHSSTAGRRDPDWNSPYDVPLDHLEAGIRAMLGPEAA